MALGNLYNSIDRPEDAASLLRNAADQYVAIGDMQGEGRSRYNLGQALRRLGRWDEARQAIRLAIECKEPFGHAAETWNSWAALAEIEVGLGNASAGAQARANAIACYLSYRRDGGENHNEDGRISLAVTEKLRAGDTAGAASDLDELSTRPDMPNWLRQFIVALRAIVAGSRDRSLAETPDLAFTSAAEFLILIDVLEG